MRFSPKHLSRFLAALLLVAIAGSSQAQYIMKQVQGRVPASAVMALGENSDSPDGAFYASLTKEQYYEKAQELGEKIEETTSVVYVDGQNFAAETEAMGDKITMIYHENGDIFIVNWKQKKVIKTSLDELKNMQKSAMDMMGQTSGAMPDMESILSSLPEENRKAAMDALKKMGKQPGAMGMPEEKPEIEKTGKTKEMLGHETTLYLISQGPKTRGVWVAKDDPQLVETFMKLAETFKAAMPMKNDEAEDWELIPNTFPMQTVTHSQRSFKPSVRIEYLASLEKKQPPKEKLIPPGKDQGFTEGTMMDMMPMNSKK